MSSWYGDPCRRYPRRAGWSLAGPHLESHLRRNGTVIVYHAVGPCPPASDPANLYMPVERFEAQMAFLSSRHEVVPLEEIVRGTARSGAVAITFDDGFRNVLTTAAPIMRRQGFPSTVFVPARWLGQRSTAFYEAAGCETELMTDAELRQAEECGIEIESHGHAHIDFSTATREEMEADLDASVERLSTVLGRRPRYFAYPYGRSSPYAIDAAADRFEAAFTIDEPHAGPYAFERVGISRLDGMLVFAVKASGRYLTLRRSTLGSAAYSLVRPLLPRTRRRVH